MYIYILLKTLCLYMFFIHHLNLTWNFTWNSPETHLNLDAHVNWMYMHFKFNYIPITCISVLANHNLLALQCNQTHLNCMSMNNKNMSMNCICTQWISIEFQCMSMHVNCMSMTCNCMSMTWIARLCMSLPACHWHLIAMQTHVNAGPLHVHCLRGIVLEFSNHCNACQSNFKVCACVRLTCIQCILLHVNACQWFWIMHSVDAHIMLSFCYCSNHFCYFLFAFVYHVVSFLIIF